MQPAAEPNRCVIVGASMAGMRAAEAVRRGGFDGEVVVLGDEAYPPYNRPPLSKEALFGSPAATASSLALRVRAAGVEWRLGERVVGSDLGARTVTVAGGGTLGWSGLVVATGLAARRLALPGPAVGRHVVRGVDDVTALRAELTPGARLVIVGAGFIGCEVAAGARAAGVSVDVVAPEDVALERALRTEFGRAVQRRHEAEGVRFHLGTVPVAYQGTDRVTGVELADGSSLPADVVLEAVGCVPNTVWLDGNGLDLGDGALCDNMLRVEGRADVVACGDVARFPNPLFDDVPRRVEHWTMATDTGKQAGATLARYLTGAPETESAHFTPIPTFWSDQYDLRLQSFGAVELGGDDVRVLEGDLEGDLSAGVAVGYHRDGRLVGVVLVGLAQRYMHYRALIGGAR